LSSAQRTPEKLRSYRVPARIRDLPALLPFTNADLIHDPSRDLTWAAPAPSPEDLSRFYRETYRTLMQKQKGLALYLASPNYRAQARSQASWLADRVGQLGAILDVGAAYGLFLNEVRHQMPGLERYAVEPDQDAPTELSNVAVLETDFDAFWRGERFSQGQFDAINLSHVLEHMLNPSEALANLRRLLKPGGYLQVETPNDDRAALSRDDRASDLPHLWFFGQKGLEELIRSAGFNISRSAVLGLRRDPPPPFSLRRIQRAIAIRVAGPLSLLDDADWYAEGAGRTDLRVLAKAPN
jgi:SAM-dependent methyltransferase